MLRVVHREPRDQSQIPCLFANLANKAESEHILMRKQFYYCIFQ